MLWIRKRSIKHMITWCGISGLKSSKLLLQLLRCDTGSPTALCRGVWLFLRELPDTVVSALWETSAVARSGTANIRQKFSLHAALSQQTLHLIPCVSSHDGYMSWHQRKGVKVLRLEWWVIKWITDWGMASCLNTKSDSLFGDQPCVMWRYCHVVRIKGGDISQIITKAELCKLHTSVIHFVHAKENYY